MTALRRPDSDENLQIVRPIGLGEDFVLKDGRRSYGQRMLDRDVPIEFVSVCMGHDSVETTQKFYANYRSRKVLHAVHSQLSENTAKS